jgi:hypothetical protein
VVLDKLANGATASERMALLNRCKLIADQIYNRMLQDSDAYFDNALIKTSEGSFGPVNNLVGWGVNFGFEQGYDAQVILSDWEDLD